MNATVFEVAYWAHLTERMKLDCKFIIYEMLVLVLLCALIMVYARLIDKDGKRIHRIKNQRKLKQVKVIS